MTNEDKILEWCGLLKLRATDGCQHWFEPTGDIVSPTDNNALPILDLNFYFKYAVPKLHKCSCQVELRSLINLGCVVTIHQIHPEEEEFQGDNDDPAEAFGQALLKIIQ